MKRAAYLFDLDGTLLDTSAIMSIRSRRLWKECVQRLGETVPFPGIPGLLARIREKGGKIAIVTSSVSYYAGKAAKFHHLPHDVLVAYHDVRHSKPAPDCYLLALGKLGLAANVAVGIGDDTVDVASLRGAGITSVAAAWNPHHHAAAGWDAVAHAPMDVLAI